MKFCYKKMISDKKESKMIDSADASEKRAIGFMGMSHEDKIKKKKENISKLTALYYEKMRSIGKKQNLLDHVPDSITMLFLQVICGQQKSPTKAIKLKCLDCSVWDREEVKNCEMCECALWNLRPFQKKENQIEDEEIEVE